jgi:hypothetical protein
MVLLLSVTIRSMRAVVRDNHHYEVLDEGDRIRSYYCSPISYLTRPPAADFRYLRLPNTCQSSGAYSNPCSALSVAIRACKMTHRILQHERYKAHIKPCPPSSALICIHYELVALHHGLSPLVSRNRTVREDDGERWQ